MRGAAGLAVVLAVVVFFLTTGLRRVCASANETVPRTKNASKNRIENLAVSFDLLNLIIFILLLSTAKAAFYKTSGRCVHFEVIRRQQVVGKFQAQTSPSFLFS